MEVYFLGNFLYSLATSAQCFRWVTNHIYICEKHTILQVCMREQLSVNNSIKNAFHEKLKKNRLNKFAHYPGCYCAIFVGGTLLLLTCKRPCHGGRGVADLMGVREGVYMWLCQWLQRNHFPNDSWLLFFFLIFFYFLRSSHCQRCTVSLDTYVCIRVYLLELCNVSGCFFMLLLLLTIKCWNILPLIFWKVFLLFFDFTLVCFVDPN